MTHTPGPWQYHYSRSDPNDEWVIGAAGFAPVLAFVVRDEEMPPSGATVEANARLIAAAPRLLWAARRAELHLAIADRKCYDGGSCGECLGCSAQSAFEELQKAIAEAGSTSL